ncbi:uncharacterized protein LOC131227306 isoform X2 [Magnolia sinica]|uniref:uncharacterized protein LOC131227306 isoform X2 n=1 Tax=Magnolia sinica TaxID=86752 RepID=UPI00265A7DCF|nr:uncharacterized protein LOC131227306 isoform X2 [Magnolia sinica]
MIKREILRFFSRRSSTRDCRNILINCSVMALSKDLICVGLRGFCQVGPTKGPCRNHAKSLVDVGCGFRPGYGNGLIVKGCFDHRDGAFRKPDDGLQKAHALAPYPQLVHDSEIRIEVDNGSKSMNGRAAYEHGSPLAFPDRPTLQKLAVAVDVDEADIRVHEFFKTAYFKKGIHPIPGAHQALLRLSTFCNLSIVTSRQNAIKDHTIEWIEKHYPGLFQEIHFGNHFALDGQSRSKSEICRSLGAKVLIDDNPRYAVECAEVGIKVLLFDYDNSYPWCKTGSETTHPLITKVLNWEEVEQHLVSWIIL